MSPSSSIYLLIKEKVKKKKDKRYLEININEDIKRPKY